jgi:hypothetical protein
MMPHWPSLELFNKPAQHAPKATRQVTKRRVREHRKHCSLKAPVVRHEHIAAKGAADRCTKESQQAK